MLWIFSLALAAPDVTPDWRADLALEGWNGDLTGQRISWGGGTRVRVRSESRGPVGRLSYNREGVLVFGDVRPPPPPRTTGSITQEQAIGLAFSHSKLAGPALRGAPTQGWQYHNGEWRLGWRVSLKSALPSVLPEMWIDANTGQVLAYRDTAEHASGHRYDESPLDSDLRTVDLLGLGEASTLSGDRVFAWSCVDWTAADPCTGKAQLATRDEAGDFLPSPDPEAWTDPFAEVHVYSHLDERLRWLEEEYGFVLDEPLVVTTQYGDAAAFAGDQDGDGDLDITMGQADDGLDWAYDADVLMHELGHVFHRNVGELQYDKVDTYGMQNAGRSLAEGSADTFASLVQGEPQLGEYIEVMRDLEPARSCETDLVGEIHENGLIWGHLWHQIRGLMGTERTFDLFVGTITLFDQQTQWGEAADALRQAADELSEADGLTPNERDAIEEFLFDSGIDECPRFRDGEVGESFSQHVSHTGLLSEDFLYNGAGQQWRVIVPDGATSLVVEVSGFDTDSDTLAYGVFARQGAPVEHVGETFAYYVAAKPVTWDEKWDGDTGEQRWVLSDVTPGDEWYFSVAGRNPGDIPLGAGGTGVLTLRVTAVVPEPEEAPRNACSQTGAAPLGLASVFAWAIASRRRKIGMKLA